MEKCQGKFLNVREPKKIFPEFFDHRKKYVDSREMEEEFQAAEKIFEMPEKSLGSFKIV